MKSLPKPLGAVMFDLVGTDLTQVEREMLAHPNVGGLIFFTRNYESPEQIADLSRQVREVRSNILIAVDHEGGRVQRFREGFTRVPNMGCIGSVYDETPSKALEYAQSMAWLIASEMAAVGVDFSFAPVLDLDYGGSEIIGDRAFHQTAQGVAELSKAFMQGFHEVGMSATGKHFPGHGFVAGDSHLVKPEDLRTLEEIEKTDLLPFESLIQHGLDAVMVAHIKYPNIAPETAGFSEFWLKHILRNKMGFNGVIFSDDLSMEGANIGLNYVERAQQSVQAGCDMVIVCNQPKEAERVIEQLDCTRCNTTDWPLNAPKRLSKLRFKNQALSLNDLYKTQKWQLSHALAAKLCEV